MDGDGVLDRAVSLEGWELVLHRRDGVYTIRANGRELISNRGRGSEEALARLGCAAVHGLQGPAVLVAGLGMGFTLRAALDRLPPEAEVVVVELFASVVEWNRRLLAEVAGEPLGDPRVRCVVGDVYELLDGSPSRFDLILLDVDNGPAALSLATNGRLYEARGVAVIRQSLREEGVLAVWSAGPTPWFCDRLARCGFEVEAAEVPAGGAVTHTVYVARRQLLPGPPL